MGKIQPKAKAEGKSSPGGSVGWGKLVQYGQDVAPTIRRGQQAGPPQGPIAAALPSVNAGLHATLRGRAPTRRGSLGFSTICTAVRYLSTVIFIYSATGRRGRIYKPRHTRTMDAAVRLCNGRRGGRKRAQRSVRSRAVGGINRDNMAAGAEINGQKPG
jgi:hypothetical protein